MNALRALVCASSLAVLTVAVPRAAHACGGCFHPVAEVGSSVITDHRMVFKVSTKETILWDQVRYTGDPKEFAWVLPVREGARVELSRDAWIAALDASTRTSVSGPERSCGGGGGSGSGGGCASTTTETASFSGGADDSRGGSSDAGFSGNGDVQVLSQSVIGPYQAVTIRATGGQGISDWLTTNGFAIPDEVRPTVEAYTRERFDFIALRLRPGQGVQAMRPVRVVAQGADATLPLRMVAAGVGAKVGLTLWVIGEGRYHTQNFPDAAIDYDKLTWDGRASKSNLSDMQRDALASNGGRSWITEAAIRVNGAVKPFTSGILPNPPLSNAYTAQCAMRPAQLVKCSEDELPPPDGTPDEPNDPPLADAGADGDVDADVDAGVDASVSPEAGADAGAGSKGCTKLVSGCDGFDDLEVAMRDLHASDVWVTRLRADLPVTALATDLTIEAAPEQKELDPQHHTDKFSDPTFDPCAGTRASSSDDDGGACACRTTPPLRSSLGTWTLIAATGYAASRVVRRRRR